MRKVLFNIAISFLILFSAATGQEKKEGGYELKITADKPDAIYNVNEKMFFNVSLIKDGCQVTSGSITFILSNDGATEISKGRQSLSSTPVKIEGTLSFPGFLRCQAEYKDSATGSIIKSMGCAGFDPLQIKPELPAPSDFDEFWNSKKKELAKIPFEETIKPVESGAPDIKAYDIRIKSLGEMPMTAYYAKPVNSPPRSMPAIICYQAASVESSNLAQAVSGAKMNMISLFVNAHGIGNGKSKEFYKELESGKLKGYPSQGKENRETLYFLHMFLRDLRAIDFITSQPEWDGKILMIRGSSMGGGQAFAMAGLDSRVTAFAANVPALCNHTGLVNGWPRLVKRDTNGNPENQKVFTASRYFDAVNFAERTKADALITVGFVDDTCRPTSVYTAYNNLKGNKSMIAIPLMKHEILPSTNKAFDQFFQEHVKKIRENDNNNKMW